MENKLKILINYNITRWKVIRIVYNNPAVYHPAVLEIVFRSLHPAVYHPAAARESRSSKNPSNRVLDCQFCDCIIGSTGDPNVCWRIRAVECWTINFIIVLFVKQTISRLYQIGPEAISLNTKETQSTRLLRKHPFYVKYFKTILYFYVHIYCVYDGYTGYANLPRQTCHTPRYATGS